MNIFIRFRQKSILKIISNIKKTKTELDNLVSIISIFPTKAEYFSNQNLSPLRPGMIDSFLLELKAKKEFIEFNKTSLKFLCFGPQKDLTNEIFFEDDGSFRKPDGLIDSFKGDQSSFSWDIENQKIEHLLIRGLWSNLYEEISSILTYYLFKINQIETYLNHLNYPSSKVSRVEYRRTRLIPRSIPRTIERFIDEIKLTAEDRYLQEFKFSRQQIWVAFKSFILFFIVPIVLTQCMKNVILEPFVSYTWNQYNSDFFLNAQQEQKALNDLKDFEDQMYFEQLVQFLDQSEELLGKRTQMEKTRATDILDCANLSSLSQPWNDFRSPVIEIHDERLDSNRMQCSPIFEPKKIEPKMIAIARKYNQQSIDLLLNLIGDLVTFSILSILVTIFRRELSILKAFFSEILYSLGDTTKSFFIILLTDLLVGFHSPKGWEIFIQFLLDHFAIPQNEDFVFLCVATFPVLLDTAFKYWIFRYLNRLSPSTVVTYHKMIE
uniref:Potassium/proton antiporter CemA n=1 Tax=Marsupiomonas sp. NIES 1824 TaxID=1562198 RepID=A0A097KLS1_9CHLO|nr:chloroplast enveloppe membrane protein [Marsupiomonas sp. NIES 1824]